MKRRTPSPGTHELFRYTRLRRPRILDLPSRVTSNPELRELLANREQGWLRSRAARTWARNWSRSKEYLPASEVEGLDIFRALTFDGVPERLLPTRDEIRDPAEFQRRLQDDAKTLRGLAQRAALSLFSAMVLEDQAEADRLAHTLQFLEALPQLPMRSHATPYAPVVVGRDLPAGDNEIAAPEKPLPEELESNGNSQLPDREEILRAWSATLEYRRWKEEQLTKAIAETRDQHFAFDPPKPRGKAKVSQKRIKAARRGQFKAHLQTKKAMLADLASERTTLSQSNGIRVAEMMRDDKAYQAHLRETGREDATEQASRIDWKQSPARTFEEIYRTVVHSEIGRGRHRDCVFKAEDPCIARVASDSYLPTGRDDVRPLGIGDLITIEENWMGYQPGEISSVEPILKGEVRRKEIKTTKSFEETLEQVTEEEKDTETTAESTTSVDLRSEIESEISSSFDSSLDASANGSGGGTIGVVDVTGGASFSAGLGLGLDTSLSTSEESNFSQEILNRAVERTRKATRETRATRTLQLYETTNIHEIANNSTEADHTNGVFCFLEKKVCFTEQVHGVRAFLGGEILRPGTHLLKAEMARRLLAMSDDEEPPDFNISPRDLTPENYLDYVGKYRASNVSPPPDPFKIISRTYKTDVTNENRDQGEITFRKVADVLAPFFGQYKRFLIQDNIEIPDGYLVQEVRVTVTHGSNGISIPAHLPFSLLGAAIYAAPLLATAAVPYIGAIYIPIAIWQILYTASPLMHYNADSSNVTVNVAHSTAECPYFFFQPDFILTEVIEAFGAAPGQTVEFVTFLQEQLEQLYAAFTATDDNAIANALGNVTGNLQSRIETFITELRDWLSNLLNLFENQGNAPSLDDVMDSFPPVPTDLLESVPAAIIAPFRDFFDAVVERLNELFSDTFGDILDYLAATPDNTDYRSFPGDKFRIDTLPVSFNCIALKTGITINLSAVMVRDDDSSLDAWRLETFERLSQAYYQMVADYESRNRLGVLSRPARRAPAILRREEQETLKRRIIDIIRRKYGNSAPNAPTLEEMRLFESAIDWENLTFRLFSYGPDGLQVAYEKLGLLEHADLTRKRFLKAAWAQVMIPLREDKRLEQVLWTYLKNGSVDFEAELLSEIGGNSEEAYNELTAIYRDLVLQRESVPDLPPYKWHDVLPTDLLVVFSPTPDQPFPVNPISCTNPDPAPADAAD